MTVLYSKYDVPDERNFHDVLPNKLGITDIKLIYKYEFEGFLKAQYILLEQLSTKTRFDVNYIRNIHYLALKDLYDFAGQLRRVNMTKGGFLFPTAKFLPSILDKFEKEVLNKMPNIYSNRDDLIRDIATTHAELLFIHPFREANGRVARVLANLMAIKQGFDLLGFYKISQRQFRQYINAVQSAADENYEPMRQIISSIF